MMNRILFKSLINWAIQNWKGKSTLRADCSNQGRNHIGVGGPWPPQLFKKFHFYIYVHKKFKDYTPKFIFLALLPKENYKLTLEIQKEK